MIKKYSPDGESIEFSSFRKKKLLQKFLFRFINPNCTRHHHILISFDTDLNGDAFTVDTAYGLCVQNGDKRGRLMGHWGLSCCKLSPSVYCT